MFVQKLFFKKSFDKVRFSNEFTGGFFKAIFDGLLIFSQCLVSNITNKNRNKNNTKKYLCISIADDKVTKRETNYNSFVRP